MTDPGTDSTGSESMPPVALPDRLAASLEALSAARPEGLSQAELLRVVSLLEATKGAAAALQARATARFVDDRDARVAEQLASDEISAREARCRRAAARAELALARRVSPSQADRHVGLVQGLVHDLPHTMAALTAGELSEWRATIVARETACLSHEDRMEADRRIAGCLTTAGDRELSAAAHRAAVDLDQESLVRRRRRAAASRNVSVRPAPDGMAWLSILGPLTDVVGAFAALKAAEHARHTLTGDPVVDAARVADERGRGAWMADTALELLSGRHAGQVQPVEVALVMREEAIVRTDGESDEVEVPGFGAMPGPMAREHLLRLCDSDTRTWLRRLWTAPGRRDLVAMDSQRRLFSGVLRRLIELRDASCRVPWCGAPIRDIDHVNAHAGGGETSAANAMGTCQRHNLAKESPGWSAELVADGLDPGGGPHQVRLTTPTGNDYSCVAPPLLGHGRPTRPGTSAARVRRRPEPVPDRAWSPLEVHLDGLVDAA